MQLGGKEEPTLLSRIVFTSAEEIHPNLSCSSKEGEGLSVQEFLEGYSHGESITMQMITGRYLL